jgi:hypothetical protein
VPYTMRVCHEGYVLHARHEVADITGIVFGNATGSKPNSELSSSFICEERREPQ